MKKVIMLMMMLSISLAGCGIPSEEYNKSVDLTSGGGTKIYSEPRFVVARIQVFDDTLAYGGTRAVYIITDSKTSTEYVGVSGIGISELGSHRSGKSTISDER